MSATKCKVTFDDGSTFQVEGSGITRLQEFSQVTGHKFRGASEVQGFLNGIMPKGISPDWKRRYQQPQARALVLV